MPDKSRSDMSTVYITIALAVALIIAIFWLTSRNGYKPPTYLSETPSPILSQTLTNTITATPTSTLTSTTTLIPTETPKVTSVATLSNTPPFPSPIVGAGVTNGPPLFSIESWDDYNENCWNTVSIYGVIVSHGNPPYKFTFWTQKDPFTPQPAIIKQVIPMKNSRDFVEFVPPVVIVKGSYRHVELVFQSEDGLQVIWIDDLFYPYPNNEICN